MAQLIIGVGSEANDGTGDTIRNAFEKVNTNFGELYSSASSTFSGAYADLTGKPTIPSSILNLGIADGANGQVLTTNGAGSFSFTTVSGGGGGGIALTDLSANTTTAGSTSLTYNSSTGEFLYVPPVIPTSILNLGISDSANGNILTTNGAGTFTFAPAPEGLKSRTTVVGTTATLADQATGNLNITAFKSYNLMAIQVDRAAWVRIYASSAARTADASRNQLTDPAPDSGVIAEVVTTGSGTFIIAPSALGFNFDSPVTNNMPLAVTNLSGASSTVTVTLTVLQTEA